MAASKLNPNMRNGEECSGGRLNKNKTAKSSRAPDLKGPLYVPGSGWYWLSCWLHQGQYGEFYSTALREMSDEDAEKYCKPKPATYKSAGQTSRNQSPPAARNGAESPDGDIPF